MSTSIDQVLHELESIKWPNTEIQWHNNLNPETNQLVDSYFEDNRRVCRLINIHMRFYFDDIDIPFFVFRDHYGWDLSRALYDREDALFFSDKIIHSNDRPYFDKIFHKYLKIHNSILNPKGLLVAYLNKWTDTTGKKWKSINKRSYLKDLIVVRFNTIDPSYIVNIFNEYQKKFCNDFERIQQNTDKHLEKLHIKIHRVIKIFKRKYRQLISFYVYDPNVDNSLQTIKLRNKSLLQCLVNEIFKTIDQLLDLHVYSIHSIISGVIDQFIPLSLLIDDKPIGDKTVNSNEIYVI